MSVQKIIDADTSKIILDLKERLTGFYTRYCLDLEKVCEFFNIKLLQGNYEDDNVSGALVRENGGWSIVVNDKHPLVRQRFTIAHELGHFFAITNGSEIAKTFLEDNDGVIKDYYVVNREISPDDDNYQIERQANIIAASILMPDAMVENLVKAEEDISDMADKFGVSESAMSYRLKSLNYNSIETRYQ